MLTHGLLTLGQSSTRSHSHKNLMQLRLRHTAAFLVARQEHTTLGLAQTLEIHDSTLNLVLA